MEITGEVMYLNAAGQPTIVLNSLKASFELLERRAINYSDRPRYIMAHEIMSQGLLLASMRFGDWSVPQMILAIRSRYTYTLEIQ
jgi:hypothetical protein